jgi:hypothetical protein
MPIFDMSSGTNILPGQSVRVVGRPKHGAFRPNRLIIDGTPADWIVNDIQIGGRSQLRGGGDVPGEVFSNAVADSFVSFDACQADEDFVVSVTFVGSSESGAPFICGFLGTSTDTVNQPGDRVILPMSSVVNILPGQITQIAGRPTHGAFRPDRLIIGGTPSDWIVHDIQIGGRSQFSQSGDIPGKMFATTVVDSFVSFDTCQADEDFVVSVTFVGSSKAGEPFLCAVLGTAV